MIGFVGDIHGEFGIFERTVNEAQLKGANCIIQVGDFGFYYNLLNELMTFVWDLPIYVIDGNHEDHKLLDAALFENGNDKTPVELMKNLIFVPRGSYLTIDNKNIAFLGGAASVDKQIRLRNGWHYSWGENILPEEISRLDSVEKVDILVTHVPPQSTIQKHFNPNDLRWFGLPPTWRDPNADLVENLWNRLNNPQLICGHMHRHIDDGNVTILNIHELKCI